MRGAATWSLAIAALSACAVGEDTSASSYGNPTYSPTTTPPSGSGSGSDEATSSDTSPADTSTTSGDGDTTALPADPSTGMATDADTGPQGSGGDNGMQPADGMYSDCLMAAQCVGLNTCVTILDMMDAPIDGFCSNNGCQVPATDCDPTPGGTAVPFCMMVTLNDNPDTACALDCAGGATCPGGMMCWDLGGTSVCA